MKADLGNFDEKWLREAAHAEEEAGCDIAAGFDWGSSLGAYAASTRSFIDQAKLIALLQDDLGTLLEQQDIEEIAVEIANFAQNKARDRVIEKGQFVKSA